MALGNHIDAQFLQIIHMSIQRLCLSTVGLLLYHLDENTQSTGTGMYNLILCRIFSVETTWEMKMK